MLLIHRRYWLTDVTDSQTLLINRCYWLTYATDYQMLFINRYYCFTDVTNYEGSTGTRGTTLLVSSGEKWTFISPVSVISVYSAAQDKGRQSCIPACNSRSQPLFQTRPGSTWGWPRPAGRTTWAPLLQAWQCQDLPKSHVIIPISLSFLPVYGWPCPGGCESRAPAIHPVPYWIFTLLEFEYILCNISVFLNE